MRRKKTRAHAGAALAWVGEYRSRGHIKSVLRGNSAKPGAPSRDFLKEFGCSSPKAQRGDKSSSENVLAAAAAAKLLLVSHLLSADEQTRRKTHVRENTYIQFRRSIKVPVSWSSCLPRRLRRNPTAAHLLAHGWKIEIAAADDWFLTKDRSNRFSFILPVHPSRWLFLQRRNFIRYCWIRKIFTYPKSWIYVIFSVPQFNFYC